MVQQQIDEYNRSRSRDPSQMAVEIPVEVAGLKQSSWGIGGATKFLKKGVQGAMKNSWVKMPSLLATPKAKTTNQEVVKQIQQQISSQTTGILTESPHVL